MTLPEMPTARCPVCAAAAQYSFSGCNVLRNDGFRYDYYACGSCGLYFLYPMLDAAAVASLYPEEYVEEDLAGRQKSIPRFHQARLCLHHGYRHLRPGRPWLAMARLLFPFYGRRTVPDYVPKGTLLDVGCGNGRYLKSMRSLGWTVHGVEFNRRSVEQCRAAGLAVHHGDLSSAALPQQGFDVITLRHVIEHIPTPQEFMAELAGLLKPGGLLIVETPNFNSLGWAWFSTRWYATGIPYHLMLFSPNNLELLAKQHGLALEDCFLETTPKLFLNSIDIVTGRQGRPSRKIWWRRLLAKCYVWYAQKIGRGDVMNATFRRLA